MVLGGRSFSEGIVHDIFDIDLRGWLLHRNIGKLTEGT